MLTRTLNAVAKRMLQFESGINYRVVSPNRYLSRIVARRFVREQHGPVFPREVPTLKGGQCPARED